MQSNTFRIRKDKDSMYEILSAANVKTLSDLNADKLKLLKAWSSLDADSKKVIKTTPEKSKYEEDYNVYYDEEEGCPHCMMGKQI